MSQFIIFIAPFIVLILSIVAMFWIAPKDHAIRDKK